MVHSKIILYLRQDGCKSSEAPISGDTDVSRDTDAFGAFLAITQNPKDRECCTRARGTYLPKNQNYDS